MLSVCSGIADRVLLMIPGSPLASFPGHSRLQFLIACSIKTEGEGLGERVTCVTSGRREGRREGGRCPTKNLEVLLVISCPRT